MKKGAKKKGMQRNEIQIQRNTKGQLKSNVKKGAKKKGIQRNEIQIYKEIQQDNEKAM